MSTEHAILGDAAVDPVDRIACSSRSGRTHHEA
jgi:hypothetical protein